MIEITEKAAKKIAEIMEEQGISAMGGVRFAIKSGGCSGRQYAISPEAEFGGDEKVFTKEVEEGGLKKVARVIIDQTSFPYLDGSTIDYGYVGDLMAEGFKINNPNTTGSCGCGQSASFGE